MKLTFEEIVVASYLQSLGIIGQRTSVLKSKKTNEILSDFIDKHKNNFPKSISLDNIQNCFFSETTKECEEKKIIQYSVNLAAGYKETDLIPVSEKDKVSAMKHIMASLKLEENETVQKAFYAFQPLEKDSILASSKKDITAETYTSLWNNFESDLLEFASLSFEDFIRAFDSLLEHYFWAVPLYIEENLDIGFYQHTKNTVAIASILYKYEEENPGTISESDIPKFFFVNGDISGIQKYIFELKENEFSSKLLRAKSFQLWAISEILSQYITKNYGVTGANIITSAGGKFIVMLPYLKDAENKLEELQLEIEKYFMDQFSGKLAVIISNGVTASQSMLYKNNAQDLFNEIGSMADECKQYKMQKALAKYSYKLEQHYDLLQKNGECPKCGIFPSSSLDGTCSCSNCESLVEIGKNLMHGAFVKLHSDKLAAFGDMISISERPESGAYSINEYKPGYPIMYLPYVAPKANKYELKTFQELAAQSNGKIAMFKSDVDNLGLVFSSSLGKNISLSSYADLSHTLHYFFSAYYAYFVKNHSDHNGVPYSDTIYTVFSGGDDLCLLGSWDSVMHFAEDFQKELCKFTNNNPSVTLSGGIALSSPGNPVINIATNAEDLLEKSKSYPRKENPVKNAVSVFNVSLNWEEYSEMLKTGKQIEELLESGKLTTGVVYKFIDFSNRAEQCLSGNIKDLIKQRTWKSNLVYSISRNVSEKKYADMLMELGTDAQTMVKSRVAVSYALYSQRKQ